LECEPVGDGRVIGGGKRIGLGGKATAQGQRGRALVRGEFLEDGLIVLRFDDDSDIVMVLGGGADHRRSADIDILDALLEIRALVDGCFERIEIDDQQVDRRDTVVLHRFRMVGIVANREQTAMHLGMQGLDSAVHHFRKAGQLGHILDLQSCRGDRLGSASRGDEFDVMRRQCAGELDQSGLVGNG
jgi:hypothetical protein